MPRVVVLGSSGFDLTIHLPRLPKPGETLLGGHLHAGPGGKGANQAIAARRAGAEVVFLTAFGDDDFGRRAAENCGSEGIDLTYAKFVPATPNQVALIFVGDDGANLIGVAPGASAALSAEDVDALPQNLFAAGDVLLASLEIPVPTVAAALRRARAAGMRTIVNPAPANRLASEPGFLVLVDILTPNEEEAAALAESAAQGIDGAREAAHALRSMGVRDVIVTLGEQGCLKRVAGDGRGITKNARSPRLWSKSWTPSARATPSAEPWPSRWPKDGRSSRPPIGRALRGPSR